MGNSILTSAELKINRFNEIGEHYNLVARLIYKMRSQIGNPFSDQYLPYIIAGLSSFDIGRMMGYSEENGNFVVRLKAKLRLVEFLINPLISSDLLSTDLHKHGNEIYQAYETLSDTGSGALNKNQNNHFDVGASKILHFLNPSC